MDVIILADELDNIFKIAEEIELLTRKEQEGVSK